MDEVETDLILAKSYLNKRNDAKSRKISFSLTFADYKRIMSRKTCTLSGYTLNPMEHKPGMDFFDRSLDRVDNSIGYVKSNCICVAHGVNILKGTWENPTYQLSVKDVIAVAKNIEKRLK